MGGRSCVAHVQAYRQALLRPTRGPFRSDKRGANVGESSRSAIGGSWFAAPFRECFLDPLRVCLRFLAIGLVHFKCERSFVVEFGGRVSLAGLPDAT